MKYTEKLNQYLANLTVFYVKQHNLHWLVTGKGFFVLHSKIEELYDQTAEQLDEVAERLLQLKSMPMASLKEALELSNLTELPANHIAGEEAMKILVSDYQKFLADAKEIISLASQAGDEGTVDQFVGYSKGYEKTIWLIESYLA